ncbi:pH-response regulator protein palA/RIM20 [Cyphellophora attinorum]|uniref:pH-response regulator protein palA/RIM20 n=1 Tax=Cyphellophora attinorum TaxID=1664694 RepID=A0A0N0NQU8_9EURO|nr:pH-response regulator protein palA/RIM20 [Phialophora attinorum]KPI44089.1 pH-response regulator protein palA/RIM20 [Phialophora attinorum]
MAAWVCTVPADDVADNGRNILEIPFHKSHAVDLSSAIKSYIAKHYEQSPSTFNDQLRAIDQLRDSAINVLEPHVSGLAKLQRYIAQLQYISGKFPVEIGVEFPWYPSIGYNTTKAVLQNSLRYELANVLFNLAALYTQLAFALNRTTPEGLKQAAGYGMAAAGTLAYLRKEVIPELIGTLPEDMEANTLESLEYLCLAQAQEAFWQKAVKDSMRDGTIARLAAKVSDLYSAADDAAVKSEAVSAEWIHHFRAKHHHFAAAAQYRASRDCLEKRKYGEEVARLRDSIKCVDEALTQQRWINKTVMADLQGLKTRVAEELKRAEKDNDVIYLLPVPSKSELSLIDRASMVSSKTPKEVSDAISLLGPNQPFGSPLFEQLVPYAVHEAASIYADRRDRLVNQSIIADIDTLTAQIRDKLQSLNLPGALQALEKPLGLPSSLLSKAEELRQQDALNRLKGSIDDTSRIKTNDLAIYQEGLALLDSEREEDDRARERFGTERWRRPPSKVALAKVYQSSVELQNYLNSAASSDSLVQSKIRDNEHIFRIMTGSNRDIEAHIPSSRNVTLTPEIENAAATLRAAINELTRLEHRRKRKIEALRSKAANDDISSALLKEASRLEREYPMQPISHVQFESLFERRLGEYAKERESLTSEQEEQDGLIAELEDANSKFLAARQAESTSTSGPVKARERALQELETAYLKYKEIINNLDTGRRFYNDLASHVHRFRDQCQKQVASRRVEKSEMESELISGEVGRLKLEETRRELRSERARQQHKECNAASNGLGGQDPIPAPKPTHPPSTPAVAKAGTPIVSGDVVGGTWNPAMGIRFGGPPSQAPGSAGYPQPRRPG